MVVSFLVIPLFALLRRRVNAGLFIYWQTGGPRRLRATSLGLPEVVRGGSEDSVQSSPTPGSARRPARGAVDIRT